MAELTNGLAQISNGIVFAHAEILRRRPQEFPAFEVLTVATGESIKFTFGEGWMPSVSSNENDDIVIDVPKKLGIPLMVGYLLLTGAQQSLDVYNTHLDNQIKAIELELKETELQKTLLSSKEHVAHLQHKGKEFVTVIQKNEIYQVFEVNGVSILGCRNNLDTEKNKD